MVIDLPFEGRKVEGSRKYSRRERVPKVRSRGEETITEPINSRIGELTPKRQVVRWCTSDKFGESLKKRFSIVDLQVKILKVNY